MNALALPLAGMLLAMLGELWVLQRKQRLASDAPVQTDPWLEAIANLNSGHLVLWFFRGIEVAGYAWIWQHAQPHALDGWPRWVVALGAFIAWDFGFYWLHRLHHRLGVLWAIHAVHHQGEHFNLSLGIRNSWLSSLSSLPFFVPLALVGVPVELFVAVSSIHYTVQFYNHSGLVGHAGWLERVMVTPSHHRIHHGANPEYVDKNFGGTLLLWDRLFGSFQRPVPGVAIRYGIHHWRASYNPLWLNLLPALQWLGWPAPSPGLPTTLSRQQRRQVISGAVLLFSNVVYAVHRQGQWPDGQQPLLWGLLALQTLALGAWADGRRWAVVVVSGLGLTLPLLFGAVFGLRDPLGLLPMLAMAAHGAWVLATAWRRVPASRSPA
ncbi:sterol desaturase family protein [Aquabacterium sp.]|uniref:sterol desaturase family protein n=1 Tax=Aquabacterium sp. TaxID=1872578 RepID=UPI002BF9DFC8|nr:sterol desaturase family protein [Aquabacterium sp.]HSW05657.1 sterol desaturase family protein [Aquabacterium sp.]